ncbi:MAG: hypothetical protein KAH57_06455 [Thermoplasmata archaeon]|nr:hypothetical protein [Thermoplasmata archaeon]
MIYRRSRNIRSDNTGVSNVVSLVLIAGIMISLMGMVFTTYLPAWGKDIEAQTLNSVMDSYMDLKSGVDTLAVSGVPGTSLTTKMTLGSNGGPMFGFGRCTGSLDMRLDDGLLEVSDVTAPATPIIYAQSRGNVVYTSSNTYVEEQIITLEAGAIIRDQSGIPVLKGQPNLVINRDPNTEETTIYVMLITLEGETRSDSGTGSYMIKTTLLSEQTTYYPMGSRDISNVITDRSDISLSITTDHSSLWTDIFTDMATGEGIVESDGDAYVFGDTPEYLIDSTTTPGTVTMTLYGMVGDLVLKSTVFELETI